MTNNPDAEVAKLALTRDCLIVAADNDQAAELVSICNTFGYRITCCGNAVDTTQYLGQIQPAVVIVMVDGDREDTLRPLELNNFGTALLIVAEYGSAPSSSTRALSLGANYFLCSPFDAQVLRVILMDTNTGSSCYDQGNSGAQLHSTFDGFTVVGMKNIQASARAFLTQLNEFYSTQLDFAAATLNYLQEYHWPGGLPQLRDAVEHAYIFSDSDIQPDALPNLQYWPADQSTANAVVKIPLGTTLAEAEQQLVLASLRRNRGNKKKTAEQLGVSLKTIYNRCNDYYR